MAGTSDRWGLITSHHPEPHQASKDSRTLRDRVLPAEGSCAAGDRRRLSARACA